MGGNCSGLSTRELKLPLDPCWHTAHTSRVLQPQSDGSNCERPNWGNWLLPNPPGPGQTRGLVSRRDTDSTVLYKIPQGRSGRVRQTLILSFPEAQQQHRFSRQEEDESSKQTALCHAEQHRAVLGWGIDGTLTAGFLLQTLEVHLQELSLAWERMGFTFWSIQSCSLY